MEKPNKWKKTLLPAALALALVVPAAVYAASQSDSGSDPAAGADSAAPLGRHFPGKGLFGNIKHHGGIAGDIGKHLVKFEGASVHRQKYLELLAEKYAPETLESWKAELDEQKSLAEELKKLMQDQGVRDWLDSQRENNREEAKAKMEELRQKLDSGEITKEQLKERLKDSGLPFSHDMKGEGFAVTFGFSLGTDDAAALKDAAEHRKALTEAVEADDADTIKAALAPLLADLQQRNDKLAAKIEELKTKANGQMVQPKKSRDAAESAEGAGESQA
jgi:hypothetical protein